MENNKKFKFIFFAVLIVAIYFLLKDSLLDIINEITKISLSGVLIITLLSISCNLIEGINISLLSRIFNQDFKIKSGIGYSFYFNFYKIVTFGSGSYVASVYYLEKKDLSSSEGMGVSILNYLFYKISIMVTTSMCIIFNYNFIDSNYSDYIFIIKLSYIVTIIIVTLLLFICISKNFHKLLLFILSKLKDKLKCKEVIEFLYDMVFNLRNSSKLLLKNKTIIVSEILLNIIKLLTLYIISYISIKEIHISMNILDVISITSLTTLLAGIIPTPGGVASIEFVYVLMFSIMINPVSATSAMLIYRFASFIMPFFIGGIYSILKLKNEK